MCPHTTMYASPHTTAGEAKPAPTGKKAKGNGGGVFQARLYSSSYSASLRACSYICTPAGASNGLVD